MVTPRRRRFLYAQVSWVLGVLLLLAAFDAFSYGSFALLSVLGLITIIEVLAPAGRPVQPRWRARLRWILAAGLVVAILVIGFRFVQVVSAAVVP